MADRASSPSSSIVTFTAVISSPADTHVPDDQATGHSVPVGAIAGGVVGSCAVICLALAIMVLMARRRRRQVQDLALRRKIDCQCTPVLGEHSVSQIGHVTPFVSTVPLHQNGSLQSNVVRKGATYAQTTGAPGLPANSPPSYMEFSAQSAETDSDLTVVPALLARVNNILSRLPRGTDDGPPDYHTEA